MILCSLQIAEVYLMILDGIQKWVCRMYTQVKMVVGIPINGCGGMKYLFPVIKHMSMITSYITMIMMGRI
ncbi:hypothetical protein SE17_08660 [Kouleothrix aurantiaca]|uniref:Uncharacterized protein n=1 Tax=Kouleothrix aurantiaca TaxID=186479 RepID=A0A0P9FK89_9CHLR|nr:hypothetical protein SE17_08660 [Kouleothrix aurantiaca]